MATVPQLNYPDGNGTTSNLTITTNLTGLTFTGSVDSNTVDVQINVNGAGFVSDPSLVDLSVPNFTIPNQSSFPDGLELDSGGNVIQVRAVDLAGGVSPPATINVTVGSDVELGTIRTAPTAVEIQRYANSVEVRWTVVTSDGNEGLEVENLAGFNVYASIGSGGSDTGYLRLNKDLIPADSPRSVGDFDTIVGETEYGDVQNLLDGDLVISSDVYGTVSGEFIDRKTLNTYSMLGVDRARISIAVYSRSEERRYTFRHNRTDGLSAGYLNSDTFSTVNDDDAIFYVVTAVYYDPDTGDLIESRYSQELAGSPLPLDTTVRGLRIRDQSLIARDYINEVQRTEPKLSLIPGSSLREVHVEPLSQEMQKAYFLMDFVHRSKSFTALLQIDDPNLTGLSIRVSNSQYKQRLRSALNVSDDATVQSIIDGAFDSLAQNYGVARAGLRAATVTQTFYRATAPTTDVIVAQDAVVSSSTNADAPRFRSRGSVIMFAEDASSYYNVDRGRYEITVEMSADTAGSDGNVAAGELDTVVTGADGFKTVNLTAADNGRDEWSNLELSEVAMNALLSLDTGTEGGYWMAAVGTPGLLEAKVVKSGDPFMMRDYDEIRQKHIGGKVDIYVRGTLERTVREAFAFQFDIARSVRFDVIDPSNLTLRARDSRLTPDNPIRQMLNDSTQGFGLRNHSTVPTQEYDLVGVTIIDYRTIRLNSAIPQPVTMLDDFVEGDYRYRSNNRFTPDLQPIRRVTSVVGQTSGTLDLNDGYTLYKLEDPLWNGESTIAQDYVEINQVDGVPAGNSEQVSDETHVMIGQFEEPLNSVGVNTLTIRVYNQDRSLEYEGPTSANPDYLVVGGSQTERVRIVRTTVTNIPNGSTVSVDYEHDENFTVTYVINDVLQRLQARVNSKRHVTADVLVKQSLANPLSTEATAKLLPNAVQSTVDSDVRTDTSVLADNRGIGNPIHQSDVTGVFENVNGLDYVVQPFTKFTLQDGAVRIRESVLSDSEFLQTLSLGNAAVYILTQSLPFNTSDGGGGLNVHHGVFKDELQMEHAVNLEDVGSAPGRAWIIGRDGAVIDGFSDDVTLQAAGFVTSDDIANQRKSLTANKVVVSLDGSTTPIDDPNNYSFAATYVVAGDEGTKDVTVSSIEYLTPGDITVTYKSA